MKTPPRIEALAVLACLVGCAGCTAHGGASFTQPEYKGRRIEGRSLLVLLDASVRISFESGKLPTELGDGDRVEAIGRYYERRLLEAIRSEFSFSKVWFETAAVSDMNTTRVELRASDDWVLDLDLPVEGSEFRHEWGKPDLVLIISNLTISDIESGGVELLTIPGTGHSGSRRKTQDSHWHRGRYRSSASHLDEYPEPLLNEMLIPVSAKKRTLAFRSAYLVWDNQLMREVARGFSRASREATVETRSVWEKPAKPTFGFSDWKSCSQKYLEELLDSLPFK
ncbi:MAG: hypothetical protein HY901_30780 [Deltaproteobacteria bacterium]|nr:hypothetical protein [Deltaproteobacteria bacterium]